MQADGTFRSVSGEGVTLHAHPTSLMFNRKAEYVVFGEVVEMGTGGGTKKYMRDVTKVEKGWLVEVAEGYYRVK